MMRQISKWSLSPVQPISQFLLSEEIQVHPQKAAFCLFLVCFSTSTGVLLGFAQKAPKQ